MVELSKYHEIHLFALTSEQIEEKHIDVLKKHCTSVNVYPLSNFKQGFNLIHNISTHLPFQTAMLFDNSIKHKIEREVSRLNIDLIFCQLIRMAPYAVDIALPKVIDFMDAFGIGMLRRAKLSRWPLNWFYEIESKRVLKYEEEIATAFDQRIIISEQDKAIVNTKLPIHVITNGIDTTYFHPRTTNPSFDLVFVGNMGYLPNVEAAEILVNKVSKVYKEKYHQDLNILIAGVRPSSRVIKLKSENVTVTGWYDDIRDAYSDGKIMVAPLFHGTGQQNKIMEAMAMGIPCVTTNDVNEAIKAKVGEEILASNEVETMTDQIHALITNEKLYDRISKAGNAFVSEKYSWNETIMQLNTIFNASINNLIKQ